MTTTLAPSNDGRRSVEEPNNSTQSGSVQTFPSEGTRLWTLSAGFKALDDSVKFPAAALNKLNFDGLTVRSGVILYQGVAP